MNKISCKDQSWKSTNLHGLKINKNDIGTKIEKNTNLQRLKTYLNPKKIKKQIIILKWSGKAKHEWNHNSQPVRF